MIDGHLDANKFMTVSSHVTLYIKLLSAHSLMESMFMNHADNSSADLWVSAASVHSILVQARAGWFQLLALTAGL